MPRLMPGHAVGARHEAVVLGLDPDLGHLAEAHDLVVGAAADDQAGELLGRPQSRVGAQRELPLLGLDAAGRQLDVLAAQGVLDVLHGEPARRQALAVEPDAHGVLPRAGHAHHARRRR